MAEVPALVVGGGLSALGAIRLLGKSGVRTYCFGEPGLARVSRWYRAAPGADVRQSRPAQLAAYLASGALDEAVLIPASDAAVRAVTSLPAELRNRFPASVPSGGISDQLTDKALFAELLEKAGVAGPITRRVDKLEDLDVITPELFEGAFLKPADSACFMARFGVKGLRVSSREDAIAKAASPLAEGHKLVLQEYVPTTLSADGSGPRANHILIDGFVDRNGHINGMFARQRLRMYPLDFGNTTYMVSIPLSKVAGPADDLRRLVAHIHHRGIFSGEFKQDPRDGRYKLLEINARVWWFVEYAGRCGLDVCAMSYLDALGKRIDDVTSYSEGARFAQAYFDFHAVRAMHKAGRLGLIPAALSWIGAQEPTFNWTDPLPAIYEIYVRSRLLTRWPAKGRRAS
jgi:D-aspartate ligase